MNFPAELKYSKDHEWVKVDGNVAIIGISDFAQDQLGDIVFVDIQTEGEDLAAGEVFGAIEAVKTVADALMPISGKVIEVNTELCCEVYYSFSLIYSQNLLYVVLAAGDLVL